MRLWHKDLIPYLPEKQLISQWRECCAIAKNIATKGTPNHILVNKVLDYPLGHFSYYIDLVIREMNKRNYKIKRESYINLIRNLDDAREHFADGYTDLNTVIFDGWHNDRYLKQCYYNLQEKFDCGGISLKEWHPIFEEFFRWQITIQDSLIH